MRSMSFRLKLLLAMMLVVAGATGTALYVSQQRMQAAYQNLFKRLSDAEIKSFTDQRAARLASLKNICLDLAKSVRVQQALQVALDEGDFGITNLNLRLDSEFQTRQVRGDATFACFDSEGQLILPTGDDPIVDRFGGKDLLQKRFSWVGRTLLDEPQQEAGLLSVRTSYDQLQLQDVIITKVTDPITQKTLGALLLAFPVPDLVFRGNKGLSQTESTTGIKFGIWLDGGIYSSYAIPEAHIIDLQHRIPEILKQSQTEFLVWPDEPHRVFLQPLHAGSGFHAAYQVCLYSLADLLDAQRDLKKRILIFGALTLLGALLISLVLAHGLSVPLRELVAGTNEIRRGNFDVKVRVRSRDDIGKLASSFNEMAEGLALKEKYRTVLNLVADEKVAKQLIDNQAALGGELREVSAIFCDVRGFTALTQNMPPEEVIEMLNEHMAVLARVVKQNNGVVDKFVGDALMAIFGAPISHGNDALDAAKCALSLVVEREKLNQTSRHKLRIGVGLATGKVVAGCMGSTDRLNYTVLGERVNLAARLCSQAKAGQVIIDQTTRERLGETISSAPLPELHLKGFSENIVAHELRGVGGVRLGD
jgi:class 3 adenylate cyclase